MMFTAAGEPSKHSELLWGRREQSPQQVCIMFISAGILGSHSKFSTFISEALRSSNSTCTDDDDDDDDRGLLVMMSLHVFRCDGGAV